MPHPDSFNLTKIVPTTAGQIDRLAIELEQTVLSPDLFGLAISSNDDGNTGDDDARPLGEQSALPFYIHGVRERVPSIAGYFHTR